MEDVAASPGSQGDDLQSHSRDVLRPSWAVFTNSDSDYNHITGVFLIKCPGESLFTGNTCAPHIKNPDIRNPHIAFFIRLQVVCNEYQRRFSILSTDFNDNDKVKTGVVLRRSSGVSV